MIEGLINNAIDNTLSDNFIKDTLKQAAQNIIKNKGEVPTDELINTTVNSIKNEILNSVKNNATSFLNTNIYSYTGELMNSITDVLYTNNDPTGISQYTATFLNNNISSISNTLQNTLSSFIQIGQLDSNIFENLSNTFTANLDSLKTNALNSLSDKTNSIVGNLTNSINEKIGNVFCAPRIEIGNNGIGISIPQINLENLNVSGMPVGNILNNLSKITETTKANDAVNNIKTKIEEKVKLKDAMKGLKNTSENPWKSVPDKNLPTYNSNKNIASKNQSSKSVQKRNETNTTADSSKENKNEKPLPPIETYKNDKPNRVTPKNDPRRDNCQELVLWEAKDKYVLLRDGIGNYLLLDEDKQCVRLQHKSGSYIQLSSNGNIEIEASNKVMINCVGARYVKQF